MADESKHSGYYDNVSKKLESWKNRYLPMQSIHNNWVDKRITPSLSEVALVATRLEALESTLNEHQEDFHLTVSDPAEYASLKKIIDDYYKSLFNLQVKVNTIKASLDAGVASRKVYTPFKLEKLQLPKFNGKFSEWNNFQDLFNSAVVKNTGLSDSEKMVYLKSCLTGEASSIVASFSTTNTSFNQAWELVKKRFENLREIAFSHLRKFDDLKQCQESASGLRKLIDTVNECTRSLSSMSIPVQNWDVILVFLALKKIDLESRKEWLLSQVSNALPTLKQFIDFLENRATALADSGLNPQKKSTQSSSSSSQPNPKVGDGKVHVNHSIEDEDDSKKVHPCVMCKGDHKLHQCKEFEARPLDERWKFVKGNKLCNNCLFRGHWSYKCPMKFSCRSCGKKHHALLHSDSYPQYTQKSESSSSAAKPVENSLSRNTTTTVSEPSSSTNHHNVSAQDVSVSYVPILETALVYVLNSQGEKVICRVFLDSGAGSNFITEECARRLNLNLKSTFTEITGMGGIKCPAITKYAIVHTKSRYENFSLLFETLVVPKIVGSYLPGIECKSEYDYLKEIPLADPSWNLPGKVDLLLGNRLLGKLVKAGHIIAPVGQPDARNTVFGWVIGGESLSKYKSHHSIPNHHVSTSLDSTLQRFWEIEEMESHKSMQSKEDLECETLFKATVSRSETGRYIVSLPFKPNAQPLGNSRDISIQRFTRMEAKMCKQPEIYESYNSQMKEHLEKEIMEEIPPEEIAVPCSRAYYMPHHVVSKLDSSSTKHRIVFDASAKTSSGFSLNEMLMVGPKLQVDLVPLLLRFRTYPVAVSSDIVKFYNQVTVTKESSDFQRLVWRSNPQESIKDYRMKRVTFGVTSAPYLAIRTLHQLAQDYEDQFPLVHSILTEEFLVDNLLSGGNTIEEALEKQDQIIQVIEKGQFKLRKWASNCSELVQAVPEEDRELNFPCKLATDEIVKTIGLLWNPLSDVFSVKIPELPVSKVTTKRQVLSAIARVFDPLGWLSPVTVKAKIMLQELWKAKVGWDQPIPQHLQIQWNKYCSEFQGLADFKLNRCIIKRNMHNSEDVFQVHGFSDASDDAYAACIYLKSQDSQGQVSTKLICAKTKVAPVQTQSTPRLELCGAALLVKVIKTFLNSNQLPIS